MGKVGKWCSVVRTKIEKKILERGMVDILCHLCGLSKTNKGAKKSIGTIMNFQTKIPLASSDLRIAARNSQFF